MDPTPLDLPWTRGFAAFVLAVGLAGTSAATPVESFFLESPDPAPSGGFGRVVALDGDRLLVTAPGENDGIGRAWVWRFDGETWIVEGVLEPSDGPPESGFGLSAALVGDVVLVGAPLHDERARDAGAVYVYRFDGTAWSETRRIFASDASEAAIFGWSVAVGNGFAVVGSPEAADREGRLYVYRPGEGGSLDETVLSQEPEEVFNGGFGESVAASGGDILAIERSSPRGVFYRWDGSSWSEPVLYEVESGELGNACFEEVVIEGDLAVLASPCFDDFDRPDSIGGFFVLERIDGTWTETQRILGDEPPTGTRDAFGRTAAIGGERIFGDLVRREGPEVELFGLSFLRESSGGGGGRSGSGGAGGGGASFRFESDFRASGVPGPNFGKLAADGDRVVLGLYEEGPGRVYGHRVPFCRPGACSTRRATRSTCCSSTAARAT